MCWESESLGAGFGYCKAKGQPLSHLCPPWSTAWVGCSLRAPLRALAVTCCEDTLVILEFPLCAAAFLTEFGAVCNLVRSLKRELSGLGSICVTLPNSCFLKLNFFFF